MSQNKEWANTYTMNFKTKEYKRMEKELDSVILLLQQILKNIQMLLIQTNNNCDMFRSSNDHAAKMQRKIAELIIKESVDVRKVDTRSHKKAECAPQVVKCSGGQKDTGKQVKKSGAQQKPDDKKKSGASGNVKKNK